MITILKNKGLEEKELAVAAALILGYKDHIGPQLKNAYSSAGAMHVLAVSGLHVGIIFLIFNQLLMFLDRYKKGKWMKGSLLIILLWSYASLTGLSPSVTRAATMFSFIIVAKIINRNSNIFNTLAASALLLLLYNPLLLMEVGFQLSYLAVIGIVLIQPWINSWFVLNNWFLKKVWEITAVSIAAQIATFPLGLLYFHQFPNYFMLSNLMVIPLAILILYLGLATLCCSFIPVIGDVFALLLKYLILLLNHTVSFIESLPHALSENIHFNVQDTWITYLFIMAMISLMAYRKFRYLLLGASFLILFLLSALWFNYQTLQQKELIIYHTPPFSCINVIDGRNNTLIAPQKLIEDQHKLMFHLQNNWIQHAVNQADLVDIKQLRTAHQQIIGNLWIQQLYLQFYDYKIAIVDNHFTPSTIKKKLSIDLLIISHNEQLSVTELLAIFDLKELVVDASTPYRHATKLLNEANSLGVSCWSIPHSGAYVKQL